MGGFAKGAKPAKELFQRVPYFLVDKREDIEAFLGFRHVTGIEEWRPAEKAEYIARLVDEGRDYREVMRMIGSKTQTVRQNYISYRLLLQAEKATDIPQQNFEDRFSVMYLSLRTEGVQSISKLTSKLSPKTHAATSPKYTARP